MDAVVRNPKRSPWQWIRLILVLLVPLLLIGFIAYYGLIMVWWTIPIPPDTRAAALADLDGDGDLDLFLANGKNESPYFNTVWINQFGVPGKRPGTFRPSGQRIGQAEYNGVVLGDVDNDGDIDALVSNTFAISLFLNEGGKQNGQIGTFSERESLLYGGEYWGGDHPLALGDLNGDGLLDLFAANCCGGMLFKDKGAAELLPPATWVWLNVLKDPSSDLPLQRTSQQMAGQGTSDLALGDLDGDGDLDVFMANAILSGEPAQKDQDNLPDTVWFNDGQGVFHDSGQRLGQTRSRSVALGDLDGDGDLDAFVGMHNGPHMVWLNAGGIQRGKQGTFIDSGQRLGNSGRDNSKQAVFLGDLDRDGDLDAVVTADTTAEIWINNSHANFTRSAQRIVFGSRYAMAMGDLDGDGDLDLIAGKLDEEVKVWLNDGQGSFILALFP